MKKRKEREKEKERERKKERGIFKNYIFLFINCYIYLISMVSKILFII